MAVCAVGNNSVQVVSKALYCLRSGSDLDCCEASQYLLGVGLCEVDDVVSNGLGGLIGILVGVVVDWVSRDREAK